MKDKVIAAGIHVAISVIIAFFLLVILYYFWFPSPLMQLGAVQGVELILIVDIMLGPLCTLFVYKKGKPKLVLDLTVIGILQLSALSYGLWAVYGQTPAYLVLTYDGFQVVSRFEVKTYMKQEEISFAKNLAEDTIMYAQRIPVLELAEVSSTVDRGGNRLAFEVNNDSFYYLNSFEYKQVKNILSLDAVKGGNFTENVDLSCLQAVIKSPHGTTEACLQQSGSKLSLVK